LQQRQEAAKAEVSTYSFSVSLPLHRGEATAPLEEESNQPVLSGPTTRLSFHALCVIRTKTGGTTDLPSIGLPVCSAERA